MKKIFVEMTIPANYKIEGVVKPQRPRAVIFGWFEEQDPTWGPCLAPSGLHGRNGWMEHVDVADIKEGENLPDALWIIVECGHKCSWYVAKAFVQQNNAEEYVRKNDQELAWYWALPIGRGDSVPQGLHLGQFLVKE